MQITIDLFHDTPKEMEAAIVLLQGMIDLKRIKPADNPETGKVPIPTVTLTQSLAERGMGAPPSLEIPPPPAADPAAVFGGAAAPIPPAGATPPPPPAVAPAVPAAAASAPSPVSAPPAPPTPPPAGSPSAGVELDSKGLPHDTRIHAQNRAKNQDGSWRAKRGLNDGALVKQIEDELRAVQAIAKPPAPPPAVVEQPPAAPPAAAVFGAGADPQAAIAFGAPVDPPAPADFPSLMTTLTPAMSQGRVTQALITEACAASGLPSLPLLATRPDLISTVFEYIRSRVQL